MARYDANDQRGNTLNLALRIPAAVRSVSVYPPAPALSIPEGSHQYQRLSDRDQDAIAVGSRIVRGS